jgi:flagellar hook protein FlgE
MLGSLNSGVSGMQAFQQSLDVIGNNIANSNTSGFKSGRVDFADTFSQTLQAGGSQAMQVGTGVGTGSIANQFGQGGLNSTGINTDMAINGDGFFQVSDPVTGTKYVTRDGAFHVDAAGYLVNAGNLRVQGYTDAALTTVGDIKVDATGGTPPTATVEKFTFDNTGKLTVKPTGGNAFVRGQVLLQGFQNPQALVKCGDNLYSSVAAAGPAAQLAAAGTNGVGTLTTGSLETSNVDLTNQFATLITSQRGFQANARVITTSDEILQEVVNLKR